MAKHGRKRNNITRYTRACAHITGVLCFLLSQVSHKLYNPLCNNRLHWFQKQHPTLSHFHAATPPQKHTKTPSSKQLFDLQYKTTRHFPQNDTLFLGWWSIFNSIHCDTCDSKKTKLLVRSAHTRARTKTFGQYPTSPSSNQTNPSTPPLFRIPFIKTFITKKYSSAMKQPTTNQDSTPNQYSFALLTHLFRKAKMTKRSTSKEKTAQICRFFTHWGYFYPYTNRGRAIRKSLLEQKHKNDEKERNEAIISRQTFLQTPEE